MDIEIKSPFWSPAGADGFVLDWDGVIAETRLDFTPLREKYFGGRRAMLLEEAETLAPELRQEFFAELEAMEKAGAEQAEAVDGARELFLWLNQNKIPYCIVSRNRSDIIKTCADTIGVELPEHTWGRDNMRWVKPDPHALFAAAEAIGTAPRRCVYVGDFLYDLQGARRAGMRAVLVQHENPEWSAWADVMYPKMTDLVAELRAPKPLVPWEYREIYARKSERWLVNASALTFALPADPSPTADCWLARAAALGVGKIFIEPERTLSPDDWKKNPSFDTAYMGLPLHEAASRYLATRYPLAEVVTECEEPLSAPKNSLDLQRYLERKKI